jgi:hypothetical protein
MKISFESCSFAWFWQATMSCVLSIIDVLSHTVAKIHIQMCTCIQGTVHTDNKWQLTSLCVSNFSLIQYLYTEHFWRLKNWISVMALNFELIFISSFFTYFEHPQNLAGRYHFIYSANSMSQLYQKFHLLTKRVPVTNCVSVQHYSS